MQNQEHGNEAAAANVRAAGLTYWLGVSFKTSPGISNNQTEGRQIYQQKQQKLAKPSSAKQKARQFLRKLFFMKPYSNMTLHLRFYSEVFKRQKSHSLYALNTPVGLVACFIYALPHVLVTETPRGGIMVPILY